MINWHGLIFNTFSCCVSVQQEWRQVLESQAASDQLIESEALQRERELEHLRVQEVRV